MKSFWWFPIRVVVFCIFAWFFFFTTLGFFLAGGLVWNVWSWGMWFDCAELLEQMVTWLRTGKDA